LGAGRLTYPVSVVVDAWNRVGLARDITVVVAAEKVNIANMNVSEKPGPAGSHFNHNSTSKIWGN